MLHRVTKRILSTRRRSQSRLGQLPRHPRASPPVAAAPLQVGGRGGLGSAAEGPWETSSLGRGTLRDTQLCVGPLEVVGLGHAQAGQGHVGWVATPHSFALSWLQKASDGPE